MGILLTIAAAYLFLKAYATSKATGTANGNNAPAGMATLTSPYTGAQFQVKPGVALLAVINQYAPPGTVLVNADGTPFAVTNPNFKVPVVP